MGDKNSNKTSALVLLCYKLLCENDELTRKNKELNEQLVKLAERQTSPYWVVSYYGEREGDKR